MTRRSSLVALAVIAAIAVAVPSIAAVDNADFKRISQELRKLTHRAQKKANKALKLAKQAGAQGPAGQTGAAGPAGGGGATAFAQAAGPDSTGDDTQFVQLPGGPSVTVNIPASGSFQVAASALIEEDSGGVALFQDGAPMPGQSDFCEGAAPGPPLFVSPDLSGSGLGPFTYSTPAVADGIGGCSSTGPPGPVLFNTSPGDHTYELRYAYCGCPGGGGDATFAERKLWITTLP